MLESLRSPVIFTNKARCRDCYRCVRICPVKAIRMHEGQARVVEERCIGCGTCIRECPQGAKSFRHDVDRAKRLLAGYSRVAVSLAPSFVAAYPDWRRKRLPSALRRLGFCYVGETAIGAYHVAVRTAEVVEQQGGAHVCTACPAAVRFVERYRPEMVDHLVPVVSPMIAHARLIRQRLGDDAKVVFVGPCVAKKSEAERPEYAGVVDCVLTFVELEQWLAAEGIELSECEESEFDEVPAGESRLFPLEGGSVRTAGWTTDLLAGEVIAASGFEEVCAALDEAAVDGASTVVEPLLCPHGCINGPAMPAEANPFARRGSVLEYSAENPGRTSDAAAASVLEARYRARPGDDPPLNEQEIRRVLEMTGKARDEDQLNCGACGYCSCREKAIAVLRGLAEPEMCLPYMKRLAEQRTDRIIETSPNGIVILDERLAILHMNPAFRRYFLCSDAMCGQPISRLMDPGPFERLASGQAPMVELTVEHKPYNLVCHQILYPLPEDRQYVGIFVNITSSRASQQKLDQLRAETIAQARDLLEQQVQMAENIARCLGESTARGEDLLDKLMRMAEGSAEPPAGRKDRWLQDTYTSK